MAAAVEKETSARDFLRFGLSGGQPGRARPVFSAYLTCSQKTELFQLESLSRKHKLYLACMILSGLFFQSEILAYGSRFRE
jgi:hypothetical protein